MRLQPDSIVLSAATFDAKIMAGNIIPAVATSTSVASALTCMDVFRVALHKSSPVTFFRHYMDLKCGLSFEAFFAPEPALSTITTAAGSFQVHLI
jgi:hypothetical protein